MHYRIYDNIHEQHKDQIRAAGLVLVVTVGLPILSALLNHTYVHYPWPWGSGTDNGSHASVVSANPATTSGTNGATGDHPGQTNSAGKSHTVTPSWMNGTSAATLMAPLPSVAGKGGGPVSSTASSLPSMPCPPSNTTSASPAPELNTTPVTSTVTKTLNEATNDVTQPVPVPVPAPTTTSTTNTGGTGGTSSTQLSAPSPVTGPTVSPPTGSTSVSSPVGSASVSTPSTDIKLNTSTGSVQTQVDANLSQPALNVKLGL